MIFIFVRLTCFLLLFFSTQFFQSAHAAEHEEFVKKCLIHSGLEKDSFKLVPIKGLNDFYTNGLMKQICFDPDLLKKLSEIGQKIALGHEVAHCSIFSKSPVFNFFEKAMGGVAQKVFLPYSVSVFSLLMLKLMLKGYERVAPHKIKNIEKKHVLLNKILYPLTGIGILFAWLCRRARLEELWADKKAILYLSSLQKDVNNNGISITICKEAVNLFNSFADTSSSQNLFSLHPPLEVRIGQIESLISPKS